MRGRMIGIGVVAGLLLGGLLTAVLEWTMPRSLPPTVVTGAAQIGGPFELNDAAGRTVRDKDFRGKVVVLYFGAIRDDDVSAAALLVLQGALDRLDADKKATVALFIGLDPERDPPAALAEFVRRAAPDVLALHGNFIKINELARSYHHHFVRVERADMTDGYSVDHPSIYYVLDRAGQYATHIPYATDPAELAAALSKVLKQ